MPTIPASQLVSINPSVLNAGGSALALNGLFLTNNVRVPTNTILSFPNDGVSVSNYFGASAVETTIANIYFAGYNNSTRKPTNILFTQYNNTAVGAYLRGGPVNVLSISALQGLSGSLSVIIDGYTYSAASINLSSASSYSAAATLIQTGLNTTLPTGASVTGAIAAATASVTASIAGNVMYVTAVSSGTLVTGAIISGTGVTASTQISTQLSGTTGGIGTYAVSITQVVASTTVTATYGTLTVTAVASGTLAVGQAITGSGITAGTRITALGTGSGAAGTYFVQTSQTATSTTVTATAPPLTVTYDSVAGAFQINSGMVGSQSTAAFATGTLAAGIYLTSMTGAVTSQGSNVLTPSAFMTNVVSLSQNWATFTTVIDPDAGARTDQKLAFAIWVNGQNNRYAYVESDTDLSATLSASATSSFGYIVKTAGYNGTIAVYDPNAQNIAAFVCGVAASIDTNALNGRITFAFRGQDGLTAGVTTATAASNLLANGYNFYGAYATANQSFLQLQNGQVSGKYLWADSYLNQIWLNSALQLALMTLLANINSIPYNSTGYALIAAAMKDPIDAAVKFGAIRTGVSLSKQQIASINNAVGQDVSNALYVQGWYLQIVDASSQVRAARQSPSLNFWYVDGQSVQQITLASILVQ